MKKIYKLKHVLITNLLICFNFMVLAQSNHTVAFSGNTSDFNAAEKYASVDNVDYYVTYDATYVYFGAFRNGGNSWANLDHFTIYIDNFGTGAGSATGVNWDGNTPTLPFASDYRIAIRNNAGGESFLSTFSGSWSTGAANAQGWSQNTSAAADGGLEVRIPWSDLGNPNAIRFFTYASYTTGYYGYAPSGTSGVGPSAASQWFGTIGTKSADCIPTNTTNLSLTGTGSLTNVVPAAAGVYARVIINAGTITNLNAWTLAPGGILEVSGGTFAIGAQTITFGNATTANGKGTTISTSGAGVLTTIATSVLTFGGEGNVIGNNLNVNGTVRIANKFTPLASGGLTFNSGAALDIRANGYVNTNAPNYAAGSNLNYNSGGAFSAGTEWVSNLMSGIGVPSNVNIGNTIAASQLDFGSDVQFRRLTGNLTLSATATFSLSSSAGGDLQIGGNFSNTSGSVFNNNSRMVTFNGTAAQNLNTTALVFHTLTISNSLATVTALANAVVSSNLTIDANSRLNIATTTLTITGATSAINGFLRSAGSITGASPATLIFNSGGSYEHNYTTALGVIPSATWNIGSNCQIIGYTAALTATAVNGFGQNFSNFIWNCTNQGATTFNLASQLTTISGSFSVLSTGATGTLNLSNTAATTISIGGNFSQSGGVCNISTAATTVNVSGDFVQSGGTTTISNTAAIISTLNITGNVTKTGGTLIVSSNTGAAQMLVSGNFSQSLGTTTVSSSTGAPQLNVTGTFSQSGGTINVSTAASGAAQLNITSSFTLSGGIFNVSSAAAPSILNVAGDVFNSGGTLNIGATGVSQLNANSNYIQNSGTTNISTSTGAAILNVKGSFTFTGGSLTKTISGVVVGTITFNGVLNQNVNITDPTNITNAISFRLNNTNGITIVNGSTLPINTLGSFRKTLGDVTLVGTGAIVYNAINSNLIYDGLSDINTSSNEWPTVNGPANVSCAHTALSNISLHAPRTLTGILSLSLNNRLILGANDLTVANTASAAILPAVGTATQMVVADGAGRLIRSITTGISYTWPIGEMTGTIEYSPVVLNFTSTSVARDIGFNVVNATHPQMNNPDPQTNYRNRYFGVYNSAGGNYTYTPTYNFLVADNIGAFANVKLNRYDGVSWAQAPLTTSVATNSTTTGTVDEITFPLNSGDHIVCRSKPQIYVWNESSGGTQSWAVPANWTPSRTAPNFDDILMFSNGGTSTANAIPIQSIGKIILSNNTTVTLVPAVAATLTLTGGTGNDLEIASGCTLNIGGAPAAVALTIAHLAGANNVAQIDGVITTGTNLATNAYLATNSTTNINGVFNCYGILTTTTSTTNVAGSLNSFAGTITSTAANLFINAGGAYNHNRNGGSIPTALWDLNSNCVINGITNTSLTAGLNQTFGNFTWSCAAQSAAIVMGANAFTTVNGNLSFLSTNNQILNISSTASNIAVGGNLLVDINSGTLRLNSANVAINLNLSGNFTLTSGTFTRLAGAAAVAVNFVKNTGLQTFSQSSGVFSGILNWSIGTGASTNTLQFLTNIDLGASASPFTVNQNASLDCGTYVLSNSSAAFTLSNTSPGATIITANADGIELVGALGSIQTTGARVYSANSNYVYNGTTSQNTGLGLTIVNNLFIDNSNNVNLSTNLLVNGTTTFTNGKILLHNFNFNAANSSGNPFVGINNVKYLVTNGSGQLIRTISTAGLPINYQFPVGDITNYSPVSLNFSANSILRDIGVIVTPGTVPNNLPSSDYINRRWTFTNSAAGTYTYLPTFTYVPADVFGTATNMKISRYVGPLWNEYNGTPNTTVTPPTMTLTSNLNETTGQLTSYWTGRLYASPVSYTWNGSTSNDWNTAANWTPNGVPGIIDNVVINSAAINPCVANGAFFGANNFNLSGTGNFQLTAGSELTINGNLSYVNTASATFNCSSTLNITSPTSQNIPALNYGNLNLTGGDRVLAPTGNIGICGSYTTGAGAITITGSTLNYNGTSSQTITSANYNNLIISQNRGGGVITLQPGTIVLNNNFTPSLTNFTAFVDGNTFNFNGGAGQIIPAFYYFNLTSANATRTWANTGIIDVKGTFSPAATAVNTMTGSTIRFSSTLPNINLSAYTTNTANRNFNNVIFDG
ncbi:MAG TPA: hypothetical protein PK323_11410, partial [Bacteroidia bacterium]|nr:hypothetical protein [Bacteroidia bacterium]